MKFWAAAVFVLAVSASATVGPSGIVNPNGVNEQFSHEFANNIVLIGPSGIVTRTGENRQLTHDQATFTGPHAVPVGHFVAQKAVFGPSGIVRPDGKNVQFTQGQVDNFVLRGPSGIVTKDGNNIQFTDDFQFVNRKKRSTAGFVSPAGSVGYSGIVRADGTVDQFDFETAHNILYFGPSGVILKNGKNMQFTRDLHIVGRTKRSLPLIGPSGMILEDGTPVQFRKAGATLILDGPSGMVFSDGTLVQKKGF